MRILKQLSTLLLILVPIVFSAQIHYELYGKFGFSNLNETNWESNDVIANTYSYAPSFSLGIFAVKPFKDDMFKVKVGVELETIATKVGVKEEFYEPSIDYKLGTARYYSIGVPISFSYAFEKWLDFSIGLNNKLILAKPDKSEINSYTFGFHGGFDIAVSDFFLIGLNYNSDITPFWKLNKKEIYYYSNQFSLRFSYIFNK